MVYVLDGKLCLWDDYKKSLPMGIAADDLKIIAARAKQQLGVQKLCDLKRLNIQRRDWLLEASNIQREFSVADPFALEIDYFNHLSGLC